MSERSLGEVAFDEQYLKQYLAVREEIAADGFTILGVIIAVGDTADEVYAKLAQDKREFGEAKRHFYKPYVEGGRREGLIVEDQQ